MTKNSTLVGTEPLKMLMIDPMNVRITHDPETVTDLAANIEANLKNGGVHMPLLVRKIGRGKMQRYGVIAGGRRLTALQVLKDAGAITEDFQVPVKYFSGTDEEAVEASHAENTQREDMDVADEILAFSNMHNGGKGLSLEEIAARYNISPRKVRAQVALGSLPAEAIEKFRGEDISISDLELLANCPYEDRVKEAIERIGEFCRWSNPLRSFLCQNEITADHRYFELVGRKAYEAAGGTLRQDLFGREEDMIVEDFSLLEKLMFEKVEKVAEKMRKEGWANVEALPLDRSFSEWTFTRAKKAMSEMTKEDKGMIKKLEGQIEQLTAEMDGLEWGEERRAKADERATHYASIEKIKDRYMAYTEDQMKNCFVTVYLSHNKIVAFIEDKEKAKADKGPRPEYSKKVMDQLLDAKTMAGKLELSKNTIVAKALLVASFYNFQSVRYNGGRSLQVSGDNGLSGYDGTTGPATAFSAHLDATLAKFKLEGLTEKSAVFQRCLELKSTDLDDVLAVFIARNLNFNIGSSNDPSEAHDAGEVCTALNLNMNDHYELQESVLAGATRPVIEKAVESVAEGTELMAVQKAKTKKAAVQAAFPILRDKKWLPPLLRTVSKIGKAKKKAA